MELYFWQVLLIIFIFSLIAWFIGAKIMNKLYDVHPVVCETCGATVKKNVYPYPFCKKCKGKVYKDYEVTRY